jgi:ornithine cyclodeaminase
MLHITDTQVAALLDYRGVTAALERAFHDLANDAACVHGRQRSECGGTRLSTMGAVWATEAVAGIKVYPTVAGQFSFAILLFDLATNTMIAVLDGNEITRLRTAAMTALVASKAASATSRKFTLFGAGLQGRSQAQALCEVFDFDEVCVVDPMADPEWCASLQARVKGRVRIAAAEEAVRGADIIVTATRSQQPVFNGDWLSPGAFVAAMGTSAPKGRELDDATMARAARIIVEWKPQSLAEAGEVALWSGRHETHKFTDLPELFRAEQPWQADPQDITVFKSVGVGLSDVATAHLAVKQLRLAGTAPTKQDRP